MVNKEFNKKAVHFGAGKIGRGFIAELLHDSGYEIVFGDVVDELVDVVNKNHKYYLFLIDHNFEEKIIDHVTAYSNINVIFFSSTILFCSVLIIFGLFCDGIFGCTGGISFKLISSAKNKYSTAKLPFLQNLHL